MTARLRALAPRGRCQAWRDPSWLETLATADEVQIASVDLLATLFPHRVPDGLTTEPYDSGLPENWDRTIDMESGCPVYFRPGVADSSQWDHPFPHVDLPPGWATQFCSEQNSPFYFRTDNPGEPQWDPPEMPPAVDEPVVPPPPEDIEEPAAPQPQGTDEGSQRPPMGIFCALTIQSFGMTKTNPRNALHIRSEDACKSGVI